MPASDPMPVFEPVTARRVVATPTALDSIPTEPGRTCLRLAPDEMLIISDAGPIDSNPAGATTTGATQTVDQHAIDVDDASWSGAWVETDVVLDFLSWATTWPLAVERPLLLQGMAAGVPAKVWLPPDGPSLVLVPTPLAHDLQERWR